MKTYIYDVVAPTIILIYILIIFFGDLFGVGMLDMLIGLSISLVVNLHVFNASLKTDNVFPFTGYYFFELFLVLLCLSIGYEFFEKFDNILFFCYSALFGILTVPIECFMVSKKIKTNKKIEAANEHDEKTTKYMEA